MGKKKGGLWLNDPILVAENLQKFYQMGEVTVKALKDASFELMEGEVVASLVPAVQGRAPYLIL